MARSREEFAGFVEVQLRPLLGLGYALTGNKHDAWDLVQEAPARLGTRWSRRDILDPAGGWRGPGRGPRQRGGSCGHI